MKFGSHVVRKKCGCRNYILKVYSLGNTITLVPLLALNHSMIQVL